MIRVALTPAQFAAKCAELNARGVRIADPEGTISKDGVTASYTYDGATLTVNVLHKPMLYAMSVVESKLTVWLTAPSSAGATT